MPISLLTCDLQAFLTLQNILCFKSICMKSYKEKSIIITKTNLKEFPMLKSVLSLTLSCLAISTTFAANIDYSKCTSDNPQACEDIKKQCEATDDQNCFIEYAKKVCVFDETECNDLKLGFRTGAAHIEIDGNAFVDVVISTLENPNTITSIPMLYDDLMGALKEKYSETFTDQDKAHILKYWQESCALKDGDGCFNLGLTYFHGYYVEKDLEKAKKLIEKSCDLKTADACDLLAYVYQDGISTDVDFAKATTYYQKACDLGESRSCYDLSYFYEKGYGVAQDYAKSNELSLKSCDLEYGAGCFNLAVNYANAKGTEQDYNKANEYFAKACELREGNGCGALGSNYFLGLGFEKDLEKANFYYQKACDLKDGLACTLLANNYAHGYGVKQNSTQAKNLVQRACQLGYDKACKMNEE